MSHPWILKSKATTCLCIVIVVLFVLSHRGIDEPCGVPSPKNEASLLTGPTWHYDERAFFRVLQRGQRICQFEPNELAVNEMVKSTLGHKVKPGPAFFIVLHWTILGNFREVADFQIRTLRGNARQPGIGPLADKILIGMFMPTCHRSGDQRLSAEELRHIVRKELVDYPDSRGFILSNPSVVLYGGCEGKNYERPTVNIIRQISIAAQKYSDLNKEHFGAVIAYAHSKSVSQKSNTGFFEWAKQMIHFSLGPGGVVCAALLLNQRQKTYQICGANLRMAPHYHFAGNMYIARSSWLAQNEKIQWTTFYKHRRLPKHFVQHSMKDLQYVATEMWPAGGNSGTQKDPDKFVEVACCIYGTCRDLDGTFDLTKADYSQKDLEYMKHLTDGLSMRSIESSVDTRIGYPNGAELLCRRDCCHHCSSTQREGGCEIMSSPDSALDHITSFG